MAFNVPAAPDLEEAYSDTIGTEEAILILTGKHICTTMAWVRVNGGQTKLEANVGVSNSRLKTIGQRASDNEVGASGAL